MKSLVDVNVLFALLVEAHVHHPVAWDWWERQEDGAVVLCWPTRLGVLRLLTNSRAMAGSPVLPDEALAAWQTFADDSRTAWSDPISAHEVHFRGYVSGRQPAPNLWTDAWLAAHAESMGIRLTSFDADFHSFGLADFEHLTA